MDRSDVPLWFDGVLSHQTELEHICRAIMRGDDLEALQNRVMSRFMSTSKGTPGYGQDKG